MRWYQCSQVDSVPTAQCMYLARYDDVLYLSVVRVEYAAMNTASAVYHCLHCIRSILQHVAMCHVYLLQIVAAMSFSYVQ